MGESFLAEIVFRILSQLGQTAKFGFGMRQVFNSDEEDEGCRVVVGNAMRRKNVE
jgi:hypothetical protein